MRLSLIISTLVWLAFASMASAERDVWWSLRPLPEPVRIEGNAVDHFIEAKLKEAGLPPLPQADARTLIRRATYDLIGLPPTPEEVSAFSAEHAKAPEVAYAALINRLLASPHYGERWARHWLDVVHYGDTHGYDKDQPRPNAWPYRDYVIRAFNEDKPYARFVQEQLAGDVLFPGTRDGIEALGFISAGPWDLIGHAEVSEDKIDGKIARHLDRDDMVTNTINTFASMTVHCAQCHDHKFDPISMEDYYSLHAVFAAIDRTEREYDADASVGKERAALKAKRNQSQAVVEQVIKAASGKCGEALSALDKLIAASKKPSEGTPERKGYHSAIEKNERSEKWVQLDLGKVWKLQRLLLHPCQDDFNGIGDGFGFPQRYRVEACDEPSFTHDTKLILDRTDADQPNPKLKEIRIETTVEARYLRVTATKLALRQNDFIFALAELKAVNDKGENVALGGHVSSLDSIEAPQRWQRSNLIDGWYPGISGEEVKKLVPDLQKLERSRELLLESVMSPMELASYRTHVAQRDETLTQLQKLPPPSKVYCGSIHTGNGAFLGTGAKGGKPRPIYVLSRGDVKRPGVEAKPGTISAVQTLPARFTCPEGSSEGERRAALAHWLTEAQHPLTWRSIVNRVWQYHFGRGLVETPNDFGKMGGLPSHPELLDWLAADFRDHGGSIKRLHRQLMHSAAYRRHSSADLAAMQAGNALDSENSLLWRMNRRKLEAEAVRDSLLAVSGMLDLTMGGPAFQDFKILHPEHSPHYEYQLADLTDPKLHRRSIYRFLVRSKPQPWMATLDCADPSMLVDRRTQTITPLQALAQLNNQLTLVAAQGFARTVALGEKSLAAQVVIAFRQAVQREPSSAEMASLFTHAEQYGLASACRVLLNLNEMTFVD